MDLYAKSGDGAPTVAEHNRDVRDAADAVWECIGADLTLALQLDVTNFRADILPLLQSAALLSRSGEDQFRVPGHWVRAKLGQGPKQPVRHEVVGVWLLTDRDFLGSWFTSLRPEIDIWPIIWAVAGHHLKMCDPARGGNCSL